MIGSMGVKNAMEHWSLVWWRWSGAVSGGYRRSVSGERKYPLLPLRSHALHGRRRVADAVTQTISASTMASYQPLAWCEPGCHIFGGSLWSRDRSVLRHIVGDDNESSGLWLISARNRRFVSQTVFAFLYRLSVEFAALSVIWKSPYWLTRW